MSGDLDEIYNLWEKFAVGEVGMAQITNILTNLSELKTEELPKDYLSAAVQHLGSLLENAQGEFQEKEIIETIGILKRYRNQPEVRIVQYVTCYKGMNFYLVILCKVRRASKRYKNCFGNHQPGSACHE